MFFTCPRRELRRRRKAALVVASGLALGIALVIVVDSVSNGMGKAQDKVPLCSEPSSPRASNWKRGRWASPVDADAALVTAPRGGGRPDRRRLRRLAGLPAPPGGRPEAGAVAAT
ncbi:hypothetical protein ACH5A3_12180 [Streptomyces echinatus]|uniref:hypothetical protein n=1 Tax=Streptomyces echinatus TaxID=67293 RepID=UPI0037B6DAF0